LPKVGIVKEHGALIYNALAIPGMVRRANYGHLSYDRSQRLVLSYTSTSGRKTACDRRA
jgi:hypothetical protein